ncbi:hypothetical protein [Paenibacillus antarcticus]|uniref:Helix-turn-helix conjugative transposon-like domain-containing protein n=1 Tax=Paenibacillus antarcticus TaxID=253703 RepID=A0A168LVW9_9BACL|nr:hypothetical protein [Paenibacillus antarcticus]OAB43909.1 hypothetical protein PBAT_16940 [Paenibacillus antarcticus]
MEAKNDTETIPDSEFLTLLHAAKHNHSESMLELIELYKGDIVRLSQFIHMPQEDAVSHIIVEFLEFIKSNKI